MGAIAMGVLSTLGSSPSKSRNPLQHSPDAQGDLGGQECNPVGHLSICESGRQSLPALVLLFIFFWRCGGSSGRGSAFCLAARLGSWRFASVVVSERDELGMGRSVEEADRDTKRSQLAKAGGSKPISDLRGTEGAFACDQLCEASCSVGKLACFVMQRCWSPPPSKYPFDVKYGIAGVRIWDGVLSLHCDWRKGRALILTPKGSMMSVWRQSAAFRASLAGLAWLLRLFTLSFDNKMVHQSLRKQ
ncbi:hypothetical protein TESG_06790 [Trichophyton tonsurans CBS 112818]|uniref:Uncharacterized protein n=1 Tax=Trichophyton tonsurans (strain CBS 112818) TaxID=647933 RepID=F2S7H4_TRIT1|nr:hypothetical protein TESG_06790 [Trichophyton tonsurans CBS 112818]